LSELLTVKNLTKKFGGKRVLSGVGFSVRPGEVLGLIGPNGAGKTTLFECLAGLLPDDGGSVTHGEALLASGRRKEVMFYVPEAIVPWAEQPVHWVLNFFRKLYAQSHDKLRALAMPLRLEEIRKSQLGTLSKGERKRLMLALGLLTPHPLLMLDEPFDGLDLRQTRDVMTLLRHEAASGRALLLSIHQLVDAGRVCDRLVLLNHGETVAEGTIDELRGRAGLSEGGIEEIFLALT
jgi:ABC-type multidrug transport system ATPase subunit